MLNRVPLHWLLYEELNNQNRIEVESLAKSLGLSLADDARYASSIILRSELALFGCSIPRFAYRVFFKETPGFINIRRLAHFAARIHVYKGKFSEKDENKPLAQKEIADLLEAGNQSCVADCLLPRPKYLPGDRFHLITTSLSTAYGETSPKLGIPEYQSTPFVKNITLGGGLCTQACCFMIAVILHQHASSIHGLAEITSLAHSTRRRKLNISEMDRRLMQKYISAINLSMTVQSPHAHVTKVMSRGAILFDENLSEYEIALRAYCLSNIPVVVPVDFGRMLGFKALSKSNPEYDEAFDIYKQNGFKPHLGEFDFSKTHRHCIVIVGCEHELKPQNTVFIFNDPSGHPFMYARIRQLANAAPYHDPGVSKLDQFSFWPVTPKAVKMPLLDFLPPGSYGYHSGLRWLSYWYRCVHQLAPTNPSEHFRLVQLKGIGKIKNLSPLPISTKYIDGCWNKFRSKLEEMAQQLQECHSWSSNHWVWLEMMEDAIWIWDAEMEPVVEDLEECFVARILLRGNRLLVSTPEGFDMD